jgi:outer membrane protein assembly factor BamE (lipoprotein component of BamABCDE complex)
MIRPVQKVLLFSTIALLPMLSGCLIAHSSTETRHGTYVSESTFNQIEPGQTTQSWIVATLGNPTSKSDTGNGTEIWKWQYTQTKNSSGAVFLLFAGSDTKVSDGTVFVEFHDSIVTRAWRG